MTIAFIGMGEAGSAFVSGWAGAHGPIRAYDIKTDDPATRDDMRARYAALGVEGRDTLAAALDGADLVFSTVTADQAVAAAEAAAPHLAEGAHFLDLNSCAPASKERAARAVEAAGGRYVDVAVMAPVHPRRNLVPCLICGPHAEALAPRLEALPMALGLVEGPVGRASSIKMIRSVLVKGLEALTAEFMLAAEAAGVTDEILPSLVHNYPGFDWDAQAAYNFERAMVHGVRRAAEMEEAAKTLADLGLPAAMTEATVPWQRRIAAAGAEAPENPIAAGARALAAALLPRVRGTG